MASDVAKHAQQTIHCIGYGHLDPVWLWDWREGCREMLATSHSALERMKETPGFKFSCSSAGTYQWVKRYAPKLFKEIQTAVKQGLWEIVGGWWIEPDLNLPGGESFIRQGLYGKRFFKENFGIDCIIGFNPDSFGHSGTLPKILNQLGQIYYVFMRPDEHEKSLPADVFVWEAADGSRVIASRIAHGYGCDRNLDQKIDTIFKYLDSHPFLKDGLCFFGVGDHGGGPTKENIRTIKELQQDDEQRKLDFSTLFQYFAALEKYKSQLPVVKDELQHHARGCYSVHSDIKVLNRQAENRLLSAEKWATVANLLLHRDVPSEPLEHAWQNVLFHQFHDVITGTSIRKGLEDTKMFYHESLAIAETHLFGSIRDIANQIPIEDEKGEFVVFNSLPFERTEPIEIEYIFPHEDDAVFVDDENQLYEYQELQRAELTGARRKHWVFIDTLPALGYKTYRWLPDAAVERAKPTKSPKRLEAGECWLENDYWRVEFDPFNGYIISCYDKLHSVELIEGAAAVPLVISDDSDTWSHGVARFDEQIAAFSGAKLQIYDKGDVCVSMLITSNYENSIFRQKWIIYRDSRMIDVELTIDWHERHKLLKFSMPLKMTEMTAFSDQPYGHVERQADNEEHPYQQWITLHGMATGAKGEKQKFNVSLMNDFNYSYSLDQFDLQLTLLRSAIYAHHDPTKPMPGVKYDYSDQGIHRFKLRLFTHTGEALNASVVRSAIEFNTPPYVLIDYAHAGYLPRKASFLEIEPQNVIATVFKKAEEGDVYILRCYEVEGKETTVSVRFKYNKLDAQFKIQPYQIRTMQLKLADDSVILSESNALEE
ncbi:alpha-mannosidase [candidate division KSB1 bacterium]|nr:alpha-mannosidase [candidate division KSB1 bacterium]